VAVTFGSLCKGAYIATTTLDNATTMTPQQFKTNIAVGDNPQVDIDIPVDGSVLASCMINGTSTAVWEGPTEKWDGGSGADIGAVSSGAVANFGDPSFLIAKCTHSGLYADLLAASFR
jgi:hypothetical protein